MTRAKVIDLRQKRPSDRRPILLQTEGGEIWDRTSGRPAEGAATARPGPGSGPFDYLDDLLEVAPQARVRVVVLDPGQCLPAHRSLSELCIAVLDGRARLAVGDITQRVGPGAIAFVPSGVPRGIEVESRLVALCVLAPPLPLEVPSHSRPVW